MTRRSKKLPDPQPAHPLRLRTLKAPYYAALARATDAALVDAELAVRSASLFWGDVDSALDGDLEELAQEILRARNKVVEYVRDVYGDRLAEDAL